MPQKGFWQLLFEHPIVRRALLAGAAATFTVIAAALQAEMTKLNAPNG